MERVPNRRYTKEFREEAVKMVTDEGLSILKVSSRLSLPKSILERWRRVSKRGNLGRPSKKYWMRRLSGCVMPGVTSAIRSGLAPVRSTTGGSCIRMSTFMTIDSLRGHYASGDMMPVIAG
jgi:hypothetical protein